MTTNVNKRAALVCNEDKKRPIEFKWKWGGEELPIVDQYTYLGVEISKNCFWDAQINKMIQKGKAEVGRMDVILTDSLLDTRTKRCILLNVILPKLEYAGEVWEGNKKLADKLETVQMATSQSTKIICFILFLFLNPLQDILTVISQNLVFIDQD